MIYSMTAFAFGSDQSKWGQATWEIRSINHRYLDINIKLPETLRNSESEIREQIRKRLNRGRIECHLQYKPAIGSTIKFTVNNKLVAELVKALNEINALIPKAKLINALQILAWPEVLQTHEENKEITQNAIISLFKKTLNELIATRAREGDALKTFIAEKLPKILRLVKKIKTRLPEILQIYRNKIVTHLEEIQQELDQKRLEQEMVFFAQKTDIAEELERIETHVKEISRLLQTGGYIGKNIDFMLQELNREANTLAAKSADIETTNAAVTIKVLVEQIREQTQNLE